LSIEIVGGLTIAFICMVALAWHSGSGDDEVSAAVPSSTPPETVVARPYQLEQSLSALIGYNRKLHIFRVENRDTFPWTNCQLSLNSHGISGYDLQVESIKPGLTDAALIQSAEFSDSDGNKFDPSTDRVATLDLDCETTRGHLYYRSKFGPDFVQYPQPKRHEARTSRASPPLLGATWCRRGIPSTPAPAAC
jgi:hypothetical protein